ncbi:hypothetical protein P280DRAFT_464465 [Massarina eburnea CBS 473.64]|uniref:Uncharacterized protein n=1 Tax=Massarina eburnea CBS 473.64 TaxID=1395130 RepID=A0A6A6SGR7_9PLEO|nr:hypothetical protein P280DRAFT_464465 [Massarina eburnea CBS 473.64]
MARRLTTINIEIKRFQVRPLARSKFDPRSENLFFLSWGEVGGACDFFPFLPGEMIFLPSFYLVSLLAALWFLGEAVTTWELSRR